MLLKDKNPFVESYVSTDIGRIQKILKNSGYYFSSIDDFNSENILPLLATFAVGFQRLLPNLQSIYSSWTRIRVAKASVISVLKVLDKYNKKNNINNS